MKSSILRRLDSGRDLRQRLGSARRTGGLGAVSLGPMALGQAVGLDVGRSRAVGLCAVSLWALGHDRRSLGVVAGWPSCAPRVGARTGRIRRRRHQRLDRFRWACRRLVSACAVAPLSAALPSQPAVRDDHQSDDHQQSAARSLAASQSRRRDDGAGAALPRPGDEGCVAGQKRHCPTATDRTTTQKYRADSQGRRRHDGAQAKSSPAVAASACVGIDRSHTADAVNDARAGAQGTDGDTRHATDGGRADSESRCHRTTAFAWQRSGAARATAEVQSRSADFDTDAATNAESCAGHCASAAACPHAAGNSAASATGSARRTGGTRAFPARGAAYDQAAESAVNAGCATRTATCTAARCASCTTAGSTATNCPSCAAARDTATCCASCATARSTGTRCSRCTTARSTAARAARGARAATATPAARCASLHHRPQHRSIVARKSRHRGRCSCMSHRPQHATRAARGSCTRRRNHQGVRELPRCETALITLDWAALDRSLACEDVARIKASLTCESATRERLRSPPSAQAPQDIPIARSAPA